MNEELRKSIRVALLHVLIRSHPDSGALAQEAADAVLALPEVAALLANQLTLVRLRILIRDYPDNKVPVVELDEITRILGRFR